MKTKENIEFSLGDVNYSMRLEEKNILINSWKCNKYSVWKIENTSRIFYRYIYEKTFSKAKDHFFYLECDELARDEE